MNEQETYYTIALTRLMGFNFQTALHLYRELGGARAVYEHRRDVRAVLPGSSDRLVASLQDWDAALQRAAREMEFVARHNISVLCLGDDRYPQRLAECADAPLAMYYMGHADLNRRRVVNIIGTRRCTTYGQDLVRRLVSDLRRACPDVLIVSGLAYGIDICAHRHALQNGLDTVGVLAHGLDEIYPAPHRDTAREMIAHGGLLTEYMTETRADRVNFVKRNRIVAGMSDATILVESAAKGGGLITAHIAFDYDRQVFAYPGMVGAYASEGCNAMIRDGKAQLVTSADDLLQAMGWAAATASQRGDEAVERQLFPDLTGEEQRVVSALSARGDLPLNQLAVYADIAVSQLTGLLFQMEMKGVVRPMAGGTYHLLK